jgi:oligopeptide transport system substrate-binding protein
VKATRRASWLTAIVLAGALFAAGCGDDDDTSDGTGGDNGGEVAQGGEIIDIATFTGDPPEHIDPALNVTLDAYQVVNALYDGLTEIDATDPNNPVIKPLVAESVESNDDATVWTFKIRSDAKFSDGEAITPTSFQRAWERASDPDFAGDYSYLFNFLEGGAEKLDGTADTISGIDADDASMTLTVTLSAPYSNFDAVAGFQLFFPMPAAVESLSDQNEWENGLMIGNGPFKLEKPRTEQEIVLVRNENWVGDIFGNTSAILDKVTFRVVADPDTGYNAFEAGEADTALLPPGRAAEADENYGTTFDIATLGSYHFEINWTDPVVGGPENKLLRQAISQAIDRDAINTAVYDGIRSISTGITPEGIPGWKGDICDYCAYDPDAAQQAFDDWKAAGNELTDPIKIQVNASAGHENVVQIMVDNLAAIGIDAEAEPFPTETYFTELADGACVICRSGWYADYPTYDNFMYDLFHSDAIGGSNHGMYSNPEFDALIDEAKSTTDKDKQAELFQQAEAILLNDDIAVIPLNWYVGDYVYNDDKIANFPQTNMGLVLWEQISLKEGSG